MVKWLLLIAIMIVLVGCETEEQKKLGAIRESGPPWIQDATDCQVLQEFRDNTALSAVTGVGASGQRVSKQVMENWSAAADARLKALNCP